MRCNISLPWYPFVCFFSSEREQRRIASGGVALGMYPAKIVCAQNVNYNAWCPVSSVFPEEQPLRGVFREFEELREKREAKFVDQLEQVFNDELMRAKPILVNAVSKMGSKGFVELRPDSMVVNVVDPRPIPQDISSIIVRPTFFDHEEISGIASRVAPGIL